MVLLGMQVLWRILFSPWNHVMAAAIPCHTQLTPLLCCRGARGLEAHALRCLRDDLYGKGGIHSSVPYERGRLTISAQVFTPE